jgi:ubiquinone/menaquinone biosynthesis C-methylase UbiE
MQTFKQHKIEWSLDKIQRFWNWYHSNEAMSDQMFEFQVSSNIIEFVKQNIKLEGKVLNYGGGQGFLVKELLNNDNLDEVSACDYSNNSISILNDKFSKNSKFKYNVQLSELPSKLPSDSFDIVFFLETVEHLTDDELFSTLNEIRRVIKNNGYLICSTRNNEILEKNHIMCPDCGCVFHRVQHIRSFTSDSLSEIIGKVGFNTHFCNAVNLQSFKEKSYLNLIRKIKRSILNQVTEKNNLMFIGQMNK